MGVRKPWGLAGLGIAAGAASIGILSVLFPYKDNEAPPPEAPAAVSAPSPTLTGPRSAARTTPQHGNVALHPASLPASDSQNVGLRQQQVKAQRGDTLIGLLVEAGVDRQDAHDSVEAVRDVYNPKDLHPGDNVTLTFLVGQEHENIFHGFSLDPDPARTVLTGRDGEGNFAASEIKATVRSQTMRHESVINSSLFLDATRVGVPPQILATMIQIFSYDVDFQRDFHPGDRFEVMYDQAVTAGGQTIGDVTLSYAALILSGKKMALYRFEERDGTTNYYNEKGQSVKKALLKTPINGARLTSGFGMRMHPILGYSKMHKGVDFAAPTGTPIYAAGDGTVELAQEYMAYGNYVRIKHTSDYSTAYGHMSAIAKGMAKGKSVRQGEVIGYVGSTGRSTGPHLHYEILKKAEQVNPINVRFPSGRELAGKDLKQFQAIRKHEDGVYASLPITVSPETGQKEASSQEETGEQNEQAMGKP